LSGELTRVYRLLGRGWVEDPYSEAGRRRYGEALERFRKVLNHSWFKPLLSKRLRVVELCGGTGIGGIALTKALRLKGAEAELTILDLRGKALEVAERWGGEELGGVETLRADALELHKLDLRPDVILIYGFSAPHFDPWEMARLMASTAEALSDDGLLILEETDRRYNIFYLVGYKDVLPERVGEESITLSIHGGYDLRRGTFKRALIDPLRGESATIDLYYWGIAELSALVWLFFEEVDLFPDPRRRMAGLILARGSRGRLRPRDLAGKPRMLQEGGS
jgi:hypothetical protein